VRERIKNYNIFKQLSAIWTAPGGAPQCKESRHSNLAPLLLQQPRQFLKHCRLSLRNYRNITSSFSRGTLANSRSISPADRSDAPARLKIGVGMGFSLLDSQFEVVWVRY
jgi:hypothetical protein